MILMRMDMNMMRNPKRTKGFIMIIRLQLLFSQLLQLILLMDKDEDEEGFNDAVMQLESRHSQKCSFDKQCFTVSVVFTCFSFPKKFVKKIGPRLCSSFTVSAVFHCFSNTKDILKKSPAEKNHPFEFQFHCFRNVSLFQLCFPVSASENIHKKDAAVFQLHCFSIVSPFHCLRLPKTFTKMWLCLSFTTPSLQQKCFPVSLFQFSKDI